MARDHVREVRRRIESSAIKYPASAREKRTLWVRGAIRARYGTTLGSSAFICILLQRGSHSLSSTNSYGCTSCSCPRLTTSSSLCDVDTGACLCLPGLNGSRCNEILPGFFVPGIEGIIYEGEFAILSVRRCCYRSHGLIGGSRELKLKSVLLRRLPAAVARDLATLAIMQCLRFQCRVELFAIGSSFAIL